MCYTFFDEWGRTFENGWTKHRQNEAMQYVSANEINVVTTMVRKIMPVLLPDLTFLWGRCLQGVWQKGWNPIYGGLSWWRSADGVVGILHKNMSLEIKCLFHLHKGFQCTNVFWGSNQGYPAANVIWSRWSFKVKATYVSVGPRKIVLIKCYVS